jgi:hypothetical protein
MLSSLQQRIVELSCEVVAIDDLDEFKRVAFELKCALHEHSERLRLAAAEAKQRLMTRNFSAVGWSLPERAALSRLNSEFARYAKSREVGDAEIARRPSPSSSAPEADYAAPAHESSAENQRFRNRVLESFLYRSQ